LYIIHFLSFFYGLTVQLRHFYGTIEVVSLLLYCFFQGSLVMAFIKALQLPEEPIIIATYDGFVTAADIREGAAAIAQLAEKIEGRVYAIADIHSTTSSFAEVLEILRDQSKGAEGTTTDPRLIVVLVGSTAMGKLFVDAIRQSNYGGVTVPMFPTLEAALESFRVMHAQYRHIA
jgi:hypothetical protein